MSNRFEVSNPSTRYESPMRRNTRNSRWVDALNPRPAPQQRDGPSHEVQYATRPRGYSSHINSALAHVDDFQLEYSPDECVSPMSGKSPITQPCVGNISSVPTSSDDTRHDNLATELHSAEYLHSSEVRKGSDATVFPYFPIAVKKPELKPKSPWRKYKSLKPEGNVQQPLPIKQVKSLVQESSQRSDWWHTAKDIYKTGPQGEGQKAWKAYQNARKVKLVRAETRQNIPNVTHSPSQWAVESDHSVHAPLRPPTSQIPRNGRYIQSTLVPTTRKESEFSRTSYEVLLSIDSSIHSTLNVNKTLPPVPQLYPAPKPRRQKGPPVPSKINSEHAYHGSSNTCDLRPSPPPAKDPWWRILSDKQTPQAHSDLKAKVSHPGPLLVPNNGVTVNVAVSAGGVGGPAAASSLPTDHIHTQDFAYMKSPSLHLCQPRPLTNESGDSKGKGKEKEKLTDDTPPTHWLDRFTPASDKSFLHRPHNRRRSSDESFACQGLPAPQPDFGPQRLGQAEVDAFKHAQLYLNPAFGVSSKGKERLVPEPLFCGPWVKVEAVKEERRGEQGDYRAVEGALKEY